MKAAAGKYKEDFQASQDPLIEMLRNAPASASAAKDKAKDYFDSMFNSNKG